MGGKYKGGDGRGIDFAYDAATVNRNADTKYIYVGGYAVLTENIRRHRVAACWIRHKLVGRCRIMGLTHPFCGP